MQYFLVIVGFVWLVLSVITQKVNDTRAAVYLAIANVWFAASWLTAAS